ncbi:TetR family transcriptional regulator [Plantactinospora sp. GCM10030261]|uniref:TetR/AcrR family transcriptional regulator n=1 Tax=Plantactinospora sp. GCM10030261 TaxID=3273420 RepID=UPI00361F899B
MTDTIREANPSPLAAARERERIRVKRDVSTIAVRLFEERGYDAVTMEDVAAATAVSVATLYRRFTTKENLVCWQPDEQRAMAALLTAVQSGKTLSAAATSLARELPDDAIDAIEETARVRLRLIAGHPSLQAAVQEKARSFIDEILRATDAHDDRPRLEREIETRCVAAALEAANNAWLRGEGSLRACTLRALEILTKSLPSVTAG